MLKNSMFLLMLIFSISIPGNAGAKNDGYKVVSRINKENITLFAKEMNDLYQDFKIDFKGERYSRPFWISTANNSTYAPKMYYEDIDQDKEKELVIVLNKGYGSGVLQEEVYVYRYTNGLMEVLVDNPLAIIYKNVKTKLSNEEAEIRIGDKEYKLDITPFEIKPENVFDDIGFGGIIDYEVINNHLMVRVSGQISPAMSIGDIIIVYEHRDKMYQAKTIELITDINKNPFYGPVKIQ
jgi:hypothetical protein